MGILSWILLGLVVGLLAKFIIPGVGPGGFLVTIILGIVGAFIGGFISTRLGFGTVTGFNLPSLAIATGGAVILLLGYRMIKK